MAQEEELNKLTTIMNTMGSFLAQLTKNDESNRNAIEACFRSMAGDPIVNIQDFTI